MQIDCVLPAGALLGEGPVWCPEAGALYWVDIPASVLHRFDPADGSDRVWPLPEFAGCVALATGGRLVLALASGLAWFDPTSGAVTPFLPIEADNPRTRLNDGRCDRQGRLWVGSMQFGADIGPAGALYRCGADGTRATMLTGITVPNCLSFSPDGRTMYFADSPTRRIRAFALDPDSGEIGSEREFATVHEDEGVPDGAAVDAEGCLWVAHYNGWRVSRFRPDGRLDRVVEMPVQRPTCCSFGGPGLDTLYVTTGSRNLDEEALRRGPLAGGLFAFRPGVRGLPESRFGQPDAPML